MAIAVRHELSTARGDDKTEAGRLFEQYSDRIFGYCLHYLGCRAEAEDAVQTTYLYAHRALQRGVVPEAEYAWLHSIAKNACRWHARTMSRRGRLASGDDMDSFAAPQRFEGDDSELLMGLEDALASIPESQRRALLLREWQGLSCHEVAARLGRSPAATHALLTRARRSLARALTSLPQRPALSLDVGSLLLKLKPLLVGGTANAVATTAVVAGVAVGGGVAAERLFDAGRARPPAPATALPYGADPARGGAKISASSPGSAMPPTAIARIRPRLDDATARSTPSIAVAVPTADIGGTKESPGSVSDPGASDSSPPESSSGPSEVADVLEEPAPIPEIEPVPVPELEPPVDVPEVPPVGGDLPVDELVPDPAAPSALPDAELPGLPGLP